MKKFYDFKNGLDKNDFFYCYSPQAKAKIELTKEEDCLKSGYNESTGDYDYLTALTREKYSTGTTISAECSFESFGAPLLVISDDLWERDGISLLGLHFEVVAYEAGCNVWRIERDDSTQRGIKPYKLIHEEFKIEGNERIKISVTILDGAVSATINGHEIRVDCPDLPKQFHVGFTACEGVNRFYNYAIEA